MATDKGGEGGGKAAQAADPAKTKARKAKTTATTAKATSKATEKAAARAKGAGRAVKDTTRKAAGTTRAVTAARSGLVEDAGQAAQEADLSDGLAASAIAQVEELHYQVVVNKRGFGASRLTKVLNERWDNGWRLAHILEQRGNTVLVFEKRDMPAGGQA